MPERPTPLRLKLTPRPPRRPGVGTTGPLSESLGGELPQLDICVVRRGFWVLLWVKDVCARAMREIGSGSDGEREVSLLVERLLWCIDCGMESFITPRSEYLRVC